MGDVGLFVAFGFFVLMSIAALTSSISMLEGPVSYVVERHDTPREKATTLIGLGILVLSILIVINLDWMLDFVCDIINTIWATNYCHVMLRICWLDMA